MSILKQFLSKPSNESIDDSNKGVNVDEATNLDDSATPAEGGTPMRGVRELRKVKEERTEAEAKAEQERTEATDETPKDPDGDTSEDPVGNTDDNTDDETNTSEEEKESGNEDDDDNDNDDDAVTEEEKEEAAEALESIKKELLIACESRGATAKDAEIANEAVNLILKRVGMEQERVVASLEAFSETSSRRLLATQLAVSRIDNYINQLRSK